MPAPVTTGIQFPRARAAPTAFAIGRAHSNTPFSRPCRTLMMIGGVSGGGGTERRKAEKRAKEQLSIRGA